MVPPIDKNNVHWLTGECFRGAQSGESTADNNDLFPQSVLRNILSRHCFRSGSYPLWRVNTIGLAYAGCQHRDFALSVDLCRSVIGERRSLLSPKLFATDAPSSSEMSPFAIFPSLSKIAYLCASSVPPRSAELCAEFPFEPSHVYFHFSYQNRSLKGLLHSQGLLPLSSP